MYILFMFMKKYIGTWDIYEILVLYKHIYFNSIVNKSYYDECFVE